jgi:hypothetical protein
LYPEADPDVYGSWGQVPESLRAEVLRAIELAQQEESGEEAA